jgi:hypothetical protein
MPAHGFERIRAAGGKWLDGTCTAALQNRGNFKLALWNNSVRKKVAGKQLAVFQ